MGIAEFAILMVIGVPVLGGFACAIINNMIKAKIKLRELQVEEQKLQLQDKLATDEINAKILRMDDMGISSSDIASLSEQLRQLREEISHLKQDIGNRTIN